MNKFLTLYTCEGGKGLAVDFQSSFYAWTKDHKEYDDHKFRIMEQHVVKQEDEEGAYLIKKDSPIEWI